MIQWLRKYEKKDSRFVCFDKYGNLVIPNELIDVIGDRYCRVGYDEDEGKLYVEGCYDRECNTRKIIKHNKYDYSISCKGSLEKFFNIKIPCGHQFFANKINEDDKKYLVIELNKENVM